MEQDFSANHNPSNLKKITMSKKNRVTAASGGKTAVSKILITIIISKLIGELNEAIFLNESQSRVT